MVVEGELEGRTRMYVSGHSLLTHTHTASTSTYLLQRLELLLQRRRARLAII